MEVMLVANTWTNLTSILALTGGHVFITTRRSDVKLGRKATAPTDGPLLTALGAAEVIVKTGDPLVLWAFSTAGGKIRIAEAGGLGPILIDGTGTT